MCNRRCPSAQVVAQPSRQLKAKMGNEHGGRHHEHDDNGHRSAHDDHHGRYRHYPAHQEKPDAPFDLNVERVAASECPADKVSFDLNGPAVSGNVGGTLVVRRTLTAMCFEKDGPMHFTAMPSVSPGSTFNQRMATLRHPGPQ